MNSFNRLLAISGASMASALGALGIGEYANHTYQQDRRACYAELSGKPELKACLNDVGENVQNIYGLIVLGLGAVSLTMGYKAHQEHEIEVARDLDYRRAEGLS